MGLSIIALLPAPGAGEEGSRVVDWASELREGLQQLLRPGGTIAVSFAARADVVGELGREFNALAAEWTAAAPNGLSRAQAHALRNRLAGLLAALHVLATTGGLSAPEQGELEEAVEAGRRLDTLLRGGRA